MFITGSLYAVYFGFNRKCPRAPPSTLNCMSISKPFRVKPRTADFRKLHHFFPLRQRRGEIRLQLLRPTTDSNEHFNVVICVFCKLFQLAKRLSSNLREGEARRKWRTNTRGFAMCFRGCLLRLSLPKSVMLFSECGNLYLL